jgi:hypothetical protein
MVLGIDEEQIWDAPREGFIHEGEQAAKWTYKQMI